MKRTNPKNRRIYAGFTLIELLVVISIIALLIGILLPALGAARRTARQLTNSTQLRGIHQGIVTFAQSNNQFYPGLRGDGSQLENTASDSLVTQGTAATAAAGDATATNTTNGLAVAVRFEILIDGDFFTPEYMIGPADPTDTDVMADSTDAVLQDNYSYAMLDVADARANNGVGAATPFDDAERYNEWQSERISSEAIVLGDRARNGLAVTGSTGDYEDSATSGIKSIHTKLDNAANDNWRGTVVYNDNRTEFVTSHEIGIETRYGNETNQIVNDNLFNTTAGRIASAATTVVLIPAAQQDANAMLIFGGGDLEANSEVCKRGD